MILWSVKCATENYENLGSEKKVIKKYNFIFFSSFSTLHFTFELIWIKIITALNNLSFLIGFSGQFRLEEDDWASPEDYYEYQNLRTCGAFRSKFNKIFSQNFFFFIEANMRNVKNFELSKKKVENSKKSNLCWKISNFKLLRFINVIKS